MSRAIGLAAALGAAGTTYMYATAPPSPPPPPAQPAMHLVLLADSESSGAVCLDGTPAGFYLREGTDRKWVIDFRGGGWCYSEDDCLARSTTELGSSTNWPPTYAQSGIVDPDCVINPRFCDFSVAHLPYCDGDSFASDRAEPVVVKGTKLYFRGLRILKTILTTLARDHGLRHAEEVILTGCSAGGLATYLHADLVATLLQDIAPDLAKYRAVPVSGFFLDHPNVFGEPVYRKQMASIYALANASVPSSCLDSEVGKAEPWKCNFAPHALATVKTPLFVLNSAFDAWQAECIFTSEPVAANSSANGACSAAKGWESCGKQLEGCSTSQMTAVNAYWTTFQQTLEAGLALKKTVEGHASGFFVNSCFEHCEGIMADQYTKLTVNGISLRDALQKWYDDEESAVEHRYSPCSLHPTSGQHQCNPTCSASLESSREFVERWKAAARAAPPLPPSHTAAEAFAIVSV